MNKITYEKVLKWATWRASEGNEPQPSDAECGEMQIARTLLELHVQRNADKRRGLKTTLYRIAVLSLLILNLAASYAVMFRQGSLKNLMCNLTDEVYCSDLPLGPSWLE